jgi:acetate kinase
MILALNCGSSSVKFAVFDHDLKRVFSGQADGIGAGAAPLLRMPGRAAAPLPAGLLTHAEVIPHLINTVIAPASGRPSGVGHRVVHGGRDFAGPALLDGAAIEKIAALSSLAPAHQPHNLAGIDAIARALPEAPQVVCFDTAFHRTVPQHRQEMALPRRYARAGLIRYGFHGLSYEHIASMLPTVSQAAANGRTVVCHLGNGCSVAALNAGVSQYTSMGFTPLDGLMMGQRPGRLDAGAVLWLIEESGGDIEAVRRMLNCDSGLAGVSGLSSDMRALLASDAADARFAVAMFTDRLAQEIAAAAAAIGGMDALVFCGGIGENAAPVRAAALRALAWLGFELDQAANQRHDLTITLPSGAVSAHVIATNEELVIARAVQRLTADGAGSQNGARP